MTFGLLVAIAICSLCALDPVPAQTSSKDQDEAAISAIKDRWRKAYLAGDADYLASILSPTFIQTNARGQISSRDEELNELRQGDVRYTRFDSLENKIDLYGDVAVATGATWIQGTIKSIGKPIDVRVRVTDTFVRQNGKWMVVASAATAGPSPSPAP